MQASWASSYSHQPGNVKSVTACCRFSFTFSAWFNSTCVLCIDLYLSGLEARHRTGGERHWALAIYMVYLMILKFLWGVFGETKRAHYKECWEGHLIFSATLPKLAICANICHQLANILLNSWNEVCLIKWLSKFSACVRTKKNHTTVQGKTLCSYLFFIAI